MKKTIIITIIFLCNYSVKSQNITTSNEKIILVNNLNILDDYSHSVILQKIGNPTQVIDGGQDQIEEFGYQTYEYYYGKSYIMYRGKFISDIFIFDTNLSVNGIKIGDSIDKVKVEFPKYNQMSGCLKVYYDDFTLSFQFNNNTVTEITYYTPM